MSPSERHRRTQFRKHTNEMANGLGEISLGPSCPISSIYSSVPAVADCRSELKTVQK